MVRAEAVFRRQAHAQSPGRGIEAATGDVPESLDGEDEEVADETESVAEADPSGIPAAGAMVQSGPWPLRADELRYPRTARKIARMLLQLRDEGYASFFE